MSHISKWKFVALHAPRRVMGLLFPGQPVWAWKLFFMRCRYFLRRRFSGPVTTPDGFRLEIERELIAYWSFFVERECWAGEWSTALEQETRATVTLNSVIPEQPVFLKKTDVEDCEREVLAGGKQTVDRTRFLIIKAHAKEALAKIQDQLGSHWSSKQIGASDYFFARNSQ